MKINWIKIKNYKSYKDTGEISFSDGFNVIVGQNNVGKTALIEALGQRIVGNPHKSLHTQPLRINPLSEILIGISLTNTEFKELMFEVGGTVNIAINDYENSSASANAKLNNLLAHSEIELHYKITAENRSSCRVQLGRFPAHGIYTIEPSDEVRTAGEVRYKFAQFMPSEDRSTLVYIPGMLNGSETSSIESRIYSFLLDRVYVFKAERLNIGISDVGTNQILNANASNLPEVLHNLQTRSRNKFQRLNQYIHSIFPSIYGISVISKPNNQLEIVTWPNELAIDREDLMIPLADSGTGVGQALAILYVALTVEHSRPVIIDEPNSFLHPSASRKLIEILKEFPHHQFIVSTHSSEVIKAAQAKTLKLIKWTTTESLVEQLEADQLRNIKECLLEVGVKLSDVFGADQILWVEGPTEEGAFTLLQNKGLLNSTKSTNILAVRNTADFDKKNKHINLVMDIYGKLSNGNALIPAAIGFIFDKESLSPIEIEDISRQSKGLISFLPRRMYECFILVPEAIRLVMNTMPTFSDANIATETITDWMAQNSGKYTPEPFDLLNQKWLENVDAANLLKDLFSELSESKETYDKRLHSVAITEAILDMSLGQYLTELIDLLNRKLNS